MNHLSDEQLNEYLDGELPDRTQVEEHLAACADCAARLTALQALFTELDTLPEEELTRSIAPRLTLPSHSPVLPRSLRLAVTLQAILALIAIIVAAPFVMKFASPYLVVLHMPSFLEILLRAESQWIAWLDAISQYQVPNLPEIPVINISSLYIFCALAGISILWLVGNGLLLRKQ